MANYAYLTVTDPARRSIGSEGFVIGTVTLVSDGSNYNSLNDTSGDVTGGGSGVTTPGLGGIAIRFDSQSGASDVVASEEGLLRRFGFNHSISTIYLSGPLVTAVAAANVDNQAVGYIGAIKYGDSYCKLQLLTTGASAEAALAEPDDTAVTTGTYTATFIAIGK